MSLKTNVIVILGLFVIIGLVPSASHSGPDQCQVTENTVTCTGDQSDGILSGTDFNAPPITTLNVYNLSQTIAPADTVDGIDVTVTGGNDINIYVDSGIYGMTTMGVNAEGINITINGDGNLTTTSIGDITTVGLGSDGIFNYVVGDGNVTTTSVGNISTMGNHATAIYDIVGGDGNVTVHSTGDISTTHLGALGISGRIGGNGNVSITSIGNISTAETLAVGIFGRVGGNGNLTIYSSGSVVSTKAAAISTDMDGIGTINITSSGIVSGTTGIEVQIRDTGASSTINTFAKITGTGGTAIDLQGDSNDVVNLGGGTVLNGAIDFGNGNNGSGGTNANDIDTLNALPGFNGVISFADTGGTGQGDSNLASAPENVSSNIALINGGLTGVAVDPTNFATSDLFLGGLNNSILKTISNKDSNLKTPNSTLNIISFAEGNSRKSFWASGFGSIQNKSAGSNNAGVRHSSAGLITGYEKTIGGSSFGILSGYGVSKFSLEYNAGDNEVASFFGGANWKQTYGNHKINLVFLGGRADFQSSRNINTEIAYGQYGGWFISPSVMWQTTVDWLPIPAIASFRANYSTLFLDSYTETGSVTYPLTVSERNVHLFNSRFQLSIPQKLLYDSGSNSKFFINFGLDGYFNPTLNNVNATVAGTEINFSANLEDQISSFVGLDFTHTFTNQLLFTASSEFQLSFNGGYEAISEFRALYKF